MKPFLFTLAMLILFAIFLTYQTDNNTYIRQLEKLKYVADECSGAAGLLYDEEAYSEGITVYNQEEGKKIIKYLIKENLELEDEHSPSESSYWKDEVQYEIIFFDNSNTSFPYYYTDSQERFTKLIAEPTIIVEINTGEPPFRLKFLPRKDAIRSSAYEYLDR
ncbi:hypothetical protein SH1V18_11860 [Vallitalea longa]|uniref:Uncharacterized protein n=1 Tax=Vallitalea longa TaxID=2936439 RepID=A0A9W5YA32_9FIRM|nr:hypothetical protein [Vallitalea longa]GKX28706.1 hypothetical protein SH1V18_11860 [Vallitalea longa]